jgi:integrase
VEFEEQCRKESRLENAMASYDLTLAEYGEIWLKSIKQNRSASYFSSCKRHLDEINKKIGGYKLKALNPVIIQRFLDYRKSLSFTKEYAYDKGFISIIRERRLKKCDIFCKAGLSSRSLSAALKGDRISVESAKLLCNAAGVKLENGFEVVKITKPYSSAAVAKTMQVLKALLSTAKRQQLIEHNFASRDYITHDRKERSEVVCLDNIGARTLANALMGEPELKIKISLLLFIMTGIRRGECAGLEWKDVDLEKGEITIKRSCVDVAGIGVVTGATKTVQSMREITLPQTLTEIMREYKVWWDERVKMLGDRYNGCDRVFLSESGDRMHPSTFRFWLKKITTRLGLPDVTIHSLRHTNITLQILAGVPLKTVSVRAGHSTTKLTTDTYWQYFKAGDIEAAKTIDSIFRR